MSLILEALKKSESQRRLGEAPNLGTPFSARRRRRSPLPWLVLGVVAAAAIGGWWLLRPAAAPENVAKVVGANPGAKPDTAPGPHVVARTPPDAAPARPGAAASRPSARPPNISGAMPGSASQGPGSVGPISPVLPATVLPANAQPGGVAAKTASAVAPADVPSSRVAPPDAAQGAQPTASMVTNVLTPPATPAPAATAQGGTVASAPGAPNAAAVPVTPNATAATATPGAPAAATGAAAPIQSINDLPYSVRKDIPDLPISMEVYSADASRRFVIIDGDRKVEGDTIREAVALREIRPNGVVLEFQGQRFFMPRPGS